MSLLTIDKITEFFCSADEFCKEYAQLIKENEQLAIGDGKKHCNRPHEMSDSEIMTILMLYHFGSFKNFKHFYLMYIGQTLRKEFPKQLSYNRFVAIEHKVFIPMMLFLNIVCFGDCTGISFVDSSKISVCHNKRIFNHKMFKDLARRGKGTMGFFFGFKLHFVCNEKGEILSFVFTPGNTDDRSEMVFNILKKKLFGKLYGDKGYISASLFESLWNDGIHIVTGLKSNMKNRLMSLYDRIMLRKRSVIETINDELKNICDIEHTRHRSIHNFFMNLIAALGAYCFFDKKPQIKFERTYQTGQLALFF
ncbi:MAG: IS982 family transposase [Paludibacteraceae bacterium]